jgi:hypothetical protein
MFLVFILYHVIIAEIWYVGMRLSIGHVQEYITHYTLYLAISAQRPTRYRLSHSIYQARALES